MNEPKPKQLFEGSLFNQNSTLETLLRWIIAMAVVVFFILPELSAWRATLNEPKPSIVNGCVVPVYLMSSRFIPEPFPIIKEPTYLDQTVWYEDRIDQLELVMVGMINDRREIFKRCK